MKPHDLDWDMHIETIFGSVLPPGGRWRVGQGYKCPNPACSSQNDAFAVLSYTASGSRTGKAVWVCRKCSDNRAKSFYDLVGLCFLNTTEWRDTTKYVADALGIQFGGFKPNFNDESWARDRRKMIGYIHKNSKPIDGTPAEAYLRKRLWTRNVSNPHLMYGKVLFWEEGSEYHEQELDCLLSWMSDGSERFAGLNRIYFVMDKGKIVFKKKKQLFYTRHAPEFIDDCLLHDKPEDVEEVTLLEGREDTEACRIHLPHYRNPIATLGTTNYAKCLPALLKNYPKLSRIRLLINNDSARDIAEGKESMAGFTAAGKLTQAINMHNQLVRAKRKGRVIKFLPITTNYSDICSCLDQNRGDISKLQIINLRPQL